MFIDNITALILHKYYIKNKNKNEKKKITTVYALLILNLIKRSLFFAFCNNDWNIMKPLRNDRKRNYWTYSSRSIEHLHVTRYCTKYGYEFYVDFLKISNTPVNIMFVFYNTACFARIRYFETRIRCFETCITVMNDRLHCIELYLTARYVDVMRVYIIRTILDVDARYPNARNFDRVK